MLFSLSNKKYSLISLSQTLNTVMYLEVPVLLKVGMENQYNANVFIYKLVSDFIPSSVQNGLKVIFETCSIPFSFMLYDDNVDIDLFSHPPPPPPPPLFSGRCPRMT